MVDITGKSFLTATVIGGDLENITELSMKLGKIWIEFKVDFDSDNLIISGTAPINAIMEVVRNQVEKDRIQAEIDKAEI